MSAVRAALNPESSRRVHTATRRAQLLDPASRTRKRNRFYQLKRHSKRQRRFRKRSRAVAPQHDGFVEDGYERAVDGIEAEIRAQVIAEYPEE